MYLSISQNEVEAVLCARLGKGFLENTSIVKEIANYLRSYSPTVSDLMEFSSELNKLLLVKLNAATQGKLRIQQDQDHMLKVNFKLIDRLVDDLMGLVFGNMPVTPLSFSKIHEYSLQVQSLSALRILYEKYERYYSKEDYRLVIRIIKTFYSPECYRDWLMEEEEGEEEDEENEKEGDETEE